VKPELSSIPTRVTAAVTAVMSPAVGGAGLGVAGGRDGCHLPFKLAELLIPTPAIVMPSPLTSCDDRDGLRDAPPQRPRFFSRANSSDPGRMYTAAGVSSSPSRPRTS
jgi:hypothetical protein